MKTALASGLAALTIGLMSSGFGHAQSASPPTPTTRILAIGTINPGVDPAAARAILPTEVRETVKLYLDGKIDQWYSLQGRPGVAFILNVTDTAAARDARKTALGSGSSHELRVDTACAAQSASPVAGNDNGFALGRPPADRPVLVETARALGLFKVAFCVLRGIMDFHMS
jgi:hypothetical protein